MPSEKPARRLEDIVENAQAIQRYVAGMDGAAFEKEQKPYDAVERCLERISEAAAKLGDLAASLVPGQPCKEIRALGNRLRHEYAQQCQPPREMQAAIENLRFSEGAPGTAPPGWFLGPYWWNPQMIPAHEARIVSGPSCDGSGQCATVHSVSATARSRFLYQVVDFAQYRGKKLTYRADVRADVAQGSVARLLVRVHRTDCISR